MSKITDELRHYLKVYNPHDFASLGGARIYVSYSPEIRGRVSQGAQYEVIGIGFDVSPDSAWYDHGSKTFTTFHYRGNKSETRDATLQWAAEKYHITEWAKMPYRESWVEKGAYARVMSKLRDAKSKANTPQA